MGKRELIALLNLSSWCLVMVERLFLAVPRGLSAVCDFVVFPDHTHLLFLLLRKIKSDYNGHRTVKHAIFISKYESYVWQHGKNAYPIAI